jgi:hypothetical protein
MHSIKIDFWAFKSLLILKITTFFDVTKTKIKQKFD